MGAVRRQLLQALPTSPCKLLCRGFAPLQRGTHGPISGVSSAGDPSAASCPAGGSLCPPGTCQPHGASSAPVPAAPAADGRGSPCLPPLTFGGLQALGAGGLEAAQGPLDHLLVLDLHHLGGVRLVVLGARREDLARSAARHLPGQPRARPSPTQPRGSPILSAPHAAPDTAHVAQPGSPQRPKRDLHGQDPLITPQVTPNTSQHCQEPPREPPQHHPTGTSAAPQRPLETPTCPQPPQKASRTPQYLPGESPRSPPPF